MRPIVPEGRILSFNSRRLTATYLKAIARKMGLPTSATTDEIRVLIEGRLTEDGREARDVQVIVQEQPKGMGEDSACSKGTVRLFLVDETGVVIEAEVEHEAVRVVRGQEQLVVLREERDESRDGRGSEEDELDVHQELETLTQKLRESEEAIVARDEEVLSLRGEVQREKPSGSTTSTDPAWRLGEPG